MSNKLNLKSVVILFLSSISTAVIASSMIVSYGILTSETTNTSPMIYKFGYSEPYVDTTPNQVRLIG